MRNTLAVALAISIVLGGIAVVQSAEEEEQEPLRFGMDAASMGLQAQAGVKPDYGTFWIGPWTLESGWGGPRQSMTNMKEAGVTPAIHYYYWGDDISPECVEDGCWSDLHGTYKDRAGWQQLAEEFVDNLHETMGGEPVLVFMETEFNKGGMADYKPFDYYLAEKSEYIKANYPAAQIVMALGNWNRDSWSTFEESAQASDYLGLQGMRGSTRDSLSSYRSIYADTLQGVERLEQNWGKPIMLLDIALSSYPEPDYLRHQSEALEDFFLGASELQAAGVEGIIYRAWTDHPTKDLKNYYGEAERHWGLKWGSDSELKPSGEVWIAGVQSARTGEPYQSPLDRDYSFKVTFDLSPNINEWWVDTHVDSTNPLQSVEAQVNGGQWNALERTDWGSWAKSFSAPQGSDMVLRATDTSGSTLSTYPFKWMEEDPVTDDSKPVEASFTATTQSLNVTLDGSGSHHPTGEGLTYEWDLGDGATTTGEVVEHTYSASGTYPVSLTVTGSGQSDTAQQDVTVEEIKILKTDFRVSKNINEWWVEVFVDANQPLQHVEAQVDNGTWKNLPKTDWGSWAASFHVPQGSEVVFRATDIHGQTNESELVVWLQEPEKASSPSAHFNATVNGLSVQLDGSASIDPEGRELTYDWDLGDGHMASGAQTEHTYSQSGTYTVILTVDNGQHTNSTNQNVTVEASPPSAEFNATTTALNVKLDASGSSDPLGRPLGYEWDLGDGNNATGAQAEHTYTEGGTYTVMLTVDNGEHRNSTNRNISVEASPPSAEFNATTTDLRVRLDASASSDPLGRELSYEWDLGDGNNATGAQVEHTYKESGAYTVMLTVDNGQHQDSTSREIRVEAAAPRASFDATTTNLSVHLDASASSDPLGRELTYSWDLGDGTNLSGQQIGHTYSRDGTYTVTLTVDNGEHQNSTSQNINVDSPPPQASFEATTTDLSAHLDASASSDPLGRQLTYSWDLGDGTILSGEQVEHTYRESGTYLVKLSVDNGEHEDQQHKHVSVEDPTEPLDASFRVSKNVNEWWVEVYVDANNPLKSVQAKVDDGDWRDLPASDWGSWAASFHVPAGSEVVFRATDEHGQQAHSSTTIWLQEATEDPGPPALEAEFRLGANANNWWVEVYVDANNRLTQVEAEIDGKRTMSLDPTDWDSWAKSFHVKKGSHVVFRATDEFGQQVESETYIWR